MAKKTAKLNETLANDIETTAAAGGTAAAIGTGLTSKLASLMTESGMTRGDDKNAGIASQVYARFETGYARGYASKYGDAPIAAAIIANDIKVIDKATDADRATMNRFRNARKDMWNSAHAMAFPVPAGTVTVKTKGADQKRSKAAKPDSVTPSVAKIAKVTAHDEPLLLALKWAATDGKAAFMAWAAKAMPQPK